MHGISPQEGHAHEDWIGSESRVEFIDENGGGPGVRSCRAPPIGCRKGGLAITSAQP